MPAYAVTLHLPETLYKRFRRRAEWSRRSLETELLDAVASAASVEELSPELLQGVEQLQELADEELRQLAGKALSPEVIEELEALHAKQRDGGLSREEEAARASLIREYERIMLIRAQAAKLLQDRGHDVATLLSAP